MSVTEYYEDIFTSPVQSLVNPVNVRGAMGKGLALDFKLRVPGLFDIYRKLCDERKLTVDKLWRYPWIETGQQIICFPTKLHWKMDSNKDQLIDNLLKLVALRERLGIISLAIPPIGCGNGGLSYEKDMREPMFEILGMMDCEVRIVLGPKK